MEPLRQLLPLLGPWLIAGAGLLMWVRYWPLRLQLISADAWPAVTASQEGLARAGEFLTALMHAKEGWQELRLQPPGNASAGKIFVRSRLGPGLYEVRFVETKCTSHADCDADVAAAQLGANSLAALTSGEPTTASVFAGTVAQAIRWNSARVEKFLYLHALSDGSTRIYRVRSDGRVLSQKTAVVGGDAHKAICRLLAHELANNAAERAACVELEGEYARPLDRAA